MGSLLTTGCTVQGIADVCNGYSYPDPKFPWTKGQNVPRSEINNLEMYFSLSASYNRSKARGKANKTYYMLLKIKHLYACCNLLVGSLGFRDLWSSGLKHP